MIALMPPTPPPSRPELRQPRPEDCQILCALTVSGDLQLGRMNQQRLLLEIKRLDLPSDAARSQRFRWLWCSPEQILSLDFVSMQSGTEQHRVFQQGVLRFDQHGGELQLGKQKPIALCRIDPGQVSPELQQGIARILQIAH